MIKVKVLSLLLLIALCDQVVGEEGYFTVVGSHLIKLGKKYEGVVNYQGYSTEKTLQIALKDKGEDGKDEKIIDTQNVTFSGTGMKNFQFDVRTKKN